MEANVPMHPRELLALCDALEASEERGRRQTDALVGYERWEADLILDDEAWRHPKTGESLHLPWLKQGMWDRLIELQTARNKALEKGATHEDA